MAYINETNSDIASLITEIDTAADVVNKPSEEYNKWMENTSLERTLYQGNKAMIKAGQEFLFKHPAESVQAYTVRLNNSILLNAYKKTSQFLSGQVFQKNITFNEDTPEEITNLANKIDINNNDINVFAKRLFQKGIAKGFSCILIDTPILDTKTPITIEDEKKYNLRPYFTEIKPENVIGIRVDENSNQISQVRIREFVKIPVGSYGYITQERIRVVEKGRWELHYLDNEGNIADTLTGEYGIDVLPVVFFTPGEDETIVYNKPVLSDLAYLNLHHWRSNSDQIHILHTARVPLLFGKNIEVNKIPVGTATLISSTDDNASLEYVEITGNSVDQGRKDLTECESQMSLYGLQQLVPRSGNLTATEKAITSSESNSSLSSWSIDFDTFLQQAFDILGQFISIPFPDNGVSTNKNYGIGIVDNDTLTILLKATELNVISNETCFKEFKDRSAINETETWDDNQNEIEKEQYNNLSLINLNGTLTPSGNK